MTQTTRRSDDSGANTTRSAASSSGAVTSTIAVAASVSSSTVSIPDELFHQVEELARRLGKTRSEVYAEALADYVARRGKSIVDAYGRIPQDDDELAWSDAASAAMIAEEPW